MADFTSEDYDSKEILLVGLVCLDIILTCPRYPVEDSSNRAVEFAKRRGGNASNSCTVLSQLRTKCEILAPFGGDDSAEFLKADLQKHGISFKNCPVYPQYMTPFTHIVLSQVSGSRTGIHFCKDFPEISFDDFCKIDLSQYRWVHFEGRCISETRKMMFHVDAWNVKPCNQRIPYSVELEKCREETKQFIPLAEYIFVSKDFALYMGYKDMASTINGISSFAKPGAVIIVPWGDQGAMAKCANGNIVTSKSYPPLEVKDSIGAGDTFIAATVAYLCKTKSVKEAVQYGCKVAGAKVGRTGFIGLGEEFVGLPE